MSLIVVQGHQHHLITPRLANSVSAGKGSLHEMPWACAAQAAGRMTRASSSPTVHVLQHEGSTQRRDSRFLNSDRSLNAR
jgi:hypothetical protein